MNIIWLKCYNPSKPDDVEAGFCGSSVVAKYNGGFGTLDMKSYNDCF